MTMRHRHEIATGEMNTTCNMSDDEGDVQVQDKMSQVGCRRMSKVQDGMEGFKLDEGRAEFERDS
jgi:hypothetical protein